MTTQTIWKPVSREQELFLASPADEALFGGAAGGGKTDCLCMEALRQVANPRYNGILFRRTFPEITMADGIESRTLNWYPAYGGRYNASRHVWTFPSGSKIFLGHLQHEKDVADYQSAQFGYIGFDELTHFTLYQYLYMFSRNRADIDSGVRCYVRGGTNPGGTGHRWVKKRFVNAGIINRIGWFAKVNDVDTNVSRDHPYAKSRTFIPALLSSNPMLGTDYVANLRMLDPVTQKQLELGDWDAENRSDLIYPDFSDEFNVDIDADYDPNYPVFWAEDDGFTNPRCILLIQVRPFKGRPDRVVVFREYYKSHQLGEQSINEVIEWGYPYPELLYYDPAAAEFSATAISLGLSTWGGYNVVSEGIKVVRRFILTASGERRLIISPRCENLIDSLQSYKKNNESKQEQGGDPVPLKDGTEHAADALRYFLATRFLYE